MSFWHDKPPTHSEMRADGAAGAYRRARYDQSSAVVCAQIALVAGAVGIVAAITARPVLFCVCMGAASLIYLVGLYFLRSARRYEAVRRAILFRDRVVGLENRRRGANTGAFGDRSSPPLEGDEVRPPGRPVGTKRRADVANPRAL